MSWVRFPSPAPANSKAEQKPRGAGWVPAGKALLRASGLSAGRNEEQDERELGEEVHDLPPLRYDALHHAAAPEVDSDDFVTGRRKPPVKPHPPHRALLSPHSIGP